MEGLTSDSLVYLSVGSHLEERHWYRHYLVSSAAMQSVCICVWGYTTRGYKQIPRIWNGYTAFKVTSTLTFYLSARRSGFPAPTEREIPLAWTPTQSGRNALQRHDLTALPRMGIAIPPQAAATLPKMQTTPLFKRIACGCSRAQRYSDLHSPRPHISINAYD